MTKDAEPSETEGDDIAVLLYTSGTTSEPKAVVLRHRHLAAYVITSIEFASAEDDAVALVTVPPYHIAGVANTITSLYSTRRIVYLPRFTPQGWLDTVRSESVTHAFLVPTMLARVVDGEVDAGLVYRSDALAAGAAVRMITIPGAARHRNVVLMARLAQRSDDGLARAWIALVSGPAGRRAFARAGFGRP